MRREDGLASNYEEICAENRQRYGTDIGRIGPMLLADRYDDRTHFFFELLQNAEDALNRRGQWNGQRHVCFTLEPGKLTLSHFGRPFDDADVRGICGIAQSTKDQFSIGRFGIGFKSVYTFTDRPEIHSGSEDFAVENYVSPVAVSPVSRHSEETLITLPLMDDDPTATQEIVAGFKRLGPGALLFLRQIEEINWAVKNGVSGFYQRSTPEPLGTTVHRITVIGQESGQKEVDQNWLVFHRDVFSENQEMVGRVEVAFSLQSIDDKPGRWAVVPVTASPLVVFFPTAVETNLGFLVQGPYRTTPSRDNIPRHDPWNKHLVKLTADLLVEAMRWLRDNEMLDVSALRCLPLDREKFPEGAMFEPLFSAVRQALKEEPLLPRFDGGHVAALNAKLARTQELRGLFSPHQVAQLFGTEEAAWLSGDITLDRAPEIRQYVMRELGVTEMTPESVIPRLTQTFLERQSDEWISRLYEFLNLLPALRRRLDPVPLVRLSDGHHVVARINNNPQAFLPSKIETGFPSVKREVCGTLECREFLVSLGITEPDPVDDVILNVLHKYRCDPIDVDEDQYAKDIERIVAAFNSDSKTQREKLLAALRQTTFVMVVDAGDGTDYVDKPCNVYIASDRLKQLFAGVSDVMIVDDAYDCLRGEDVRELLVACGASRYLDPTKITSNLTAAEREQIRRDTGLERASWEHPPEDFTLRGLAELLDLLPTLEGDSAKTRAQLLWDSLLDLETRGSGAFLGTYKWGYFHETKVARFDASFVRLLNESAWVPDANGELHLPRFIIFDSLGWRPNPFLLTKIEFKPPIIDQLAKEAGIDPAALDLLRKLGITSLDELTSRLGIVSPPPGVDTKQKSDAPRESDEQSSANVYDDANDLYGDDMPEIPPGTPDLDGGDHATTGSRHGGRGNLGTNTQRNGAQSHDGIAGGAGNQTSHNDQGRGQGNTQGRSPASQTGTRTFISYVGTHPDEDESDPDGLDQNARMRLEEQAIVLITRIEPRLRRTPEGNPGFDLYETDSGGNQIRWVEVKSMTGSLENRPVGLSHTQFDLARQRGDAYWLYVVEYASNPAQARVLKIQNPVGHAKTFTFDRGWIEIAQINIPIN